MIVFFGNFFDHFLKNPFFSKKGDHKWKFRVFFANFEKVTFRLPKFPKNPVTKKCEKLLFFSNSKGFSQFQEMGGYILYMWQDSKKIMFFFRDHINGKCELSKTQ